MSKTNANIDQNNGTTNDQNQNKGFHPVQAASNAGKAVGNSVSKMVNRPFTIKGICKTLGLLALGAAGATVAYKKAGKFEPTVYTIRTVEVPEAPGALKISRTSDGVKTEVIDDTVEEPIDDPAEGLVEPVEEDVTI